MSPYIYILIYNKFNNLIMTFVTFFDEQFLFLAIFFALPIQQTNKKLSIYIFKNIIKYISKYRKKNQKIYFPPIYFYCFFFIYNFQYISQIYKYFLNAFKNMFCSIYFSPRKYICMSHMNKNLTKTCL